MLISQKKAVPPKIIFLANGSIASNQYNFWKLIMGYDIMASEGKSLHIPGHVVLMVGCDGKGVYIHDNSKDDVQVIPFLHLF